MTVRFRRTRLSRADELGAATVSLLVGLGAAAATYYVTRLMLSRERLSGEPVRAISSGSDDGRRTLPGGRTSEPEG